MKKKIIYLLLTIAILFFDGCNCLKAPTGTISDNQILEAHLFKKFLSIELAKSLNPGNEVEWSSQELSRWSNLLDSEISKIKCPVPTPGPDFPNTIINMKGINEIVSFDKLKNIELLGYENNISTNIAIKVDSTQLECPKADGSGKVLVKRYSYIFEERPAGNYELKIARFFEPTNTDFEFVHKVSFDSD